MTNRIAAALALAALAGCGPRRIPGTEIDNTRENRAVFAVVDEYVRALNQRDAKAVLALVAKDYFDDAGTPDPTDDLDRARLEKALASDLSRVETPRLAVTVRKIEVQDGDAFAEIFYDSYYRVQTPAGLVPRRDTDINRIRLKKEAGQWRISGGL